LLRTRSRTRRATSSDLRPQRFVSRHFGASGQTWLEQLPDLVNHYRRKWKLEIDQTLPGGLMSCVLAVRMEDGAGAVLKISGPWTPAAPEILALREWAGGPAPELLRSDEAGALLLERVLPGAQFTGGLEDPEIAQVARLLSTLHRPPSAEALRHLPTLAAIVEERIATAHAEAAARSRAEAIELEPRVDQARTVAAELRESWQDVPTLLHGDLENRNILACERRGLAAIDPLPCVGDRAYDAGYWAASAVPPRDRARATDLVADLSGLDRKRVRLWASVAALGA
jgi:streptomycin 6-kinase